MPMSWKRGSLVGRPCAVARRRHHALTTCAVVVLVSGACADDEATSPRGPTARGFVPNATHQLTGGTVNLAVPSNSAAPLLGGASWQATPLKVRRGVNVRLSMPSTMTATFNQPFPPEPWSCIPWNVPEGEVNPGMNAHPMVDSLGTVRFTVSGDSAGTVTGNPTFLRGSMSKKSDGSWKAVDYMDTLAPDSGFLYFKRYALDGECNGWVKYILAGSQTITVDFPEIVVTSNHEFVPLGSSVQFTATAVGFSPSSGNWFWSWEPVAGNSVSVGQCLGQTTCTYAPAGTGHMVVLAIDADNLLYKGESAAIEIMPCPTPDSMLNHPKLRQALLQALDSSFVDSATHVRRERAGYVYRDTTRAMWDPLALVLFHPVSLPGTTPCTGTFTPPPPNQGPWKLVAYFHTHPFSGGTASTPADIKPANCPPDHRGRRYRPGPSDNADWPTSDQLNVPGYIIDKEIVEWFDGNAPGASNPALRRSLVKRYHWNTQTCSW